jgi:hypothetical protein
VRWFPKGNWTSGDWKDTAALVKEEVQRLRRELKDIEEELEFYNQGYSKAYQREWREANKDKKREANRKWMASSRAREKQANVDSIEMVRKLRDREVAR